MSGKYTTTEQTCTCPSRKYRPGQPCKHMIALVDARVAIENAEQERFMMAIDHSDYRTTADYCQCPAFTFTLNDCEHIRHIRTVINAPISR